MSKQEALEGMRKLYEMKKSMQANRQVFEEGNDLINPGDFHQQDFDNQRIRNQTRPNSGWGPHVPRTGK